jgi:hypothetical protein
MIQIALILLDQLLAVSQADPITKLHVTQLCKIINTPCNMYSALFQVQYGNSKQRFLTKFYNYEKNYL